MKDIILFLFFVSDLLHNVLNILEDPRENEKINEILFEDTKQDFMEI